MQRWHALKSLAPHLHANRQGEAHQWQPSHRQRPAPGVQLPTTMALRRNEAPKMTPAGWLSAQGRQHFVHPLAVLPFCREVILPGITPRPFTFSLPSVPDQKSTTPCGRKDLCSPYLNDSGQHILQRPAAARSCCFGLICAADPRRSCSCSYTLLLDAPADRSPSLFTCTPPCEFFPTVICRRDLPRLSLCVSPNPWRVHPN